MRAAALPRCRLSIGSAVIALALLPQLLPVLGSGLALGLASSAFWWYQLRQQNDVLIPEVSNPTELRTAIGFGLLYAVVLFFAAWLSDIAGSGGPLLAKRCALGMTLTAAGFGVALLLMKN